MSQENPTPENVGPPYGGYPPAGGGQYPPGYGPAPRTSNDAVIALVLSIASWVVCPVVLAVIALVFAGRARTEIDGSGGWVTGDGLVTASKVLSWINIGFFLAILVVIVVVLVAAAVASTSS